MRNQFGGTVLKREREVEAQRTFFAMTSPRD